jgi:hypothetical protein
MRYQLRHSPLKVTFPVGFPAVLVWQYRTSRGPRDKNRGYPSRIGPGRTGDDRRSAVRSEDRVHGPDARRELQEQGLVDRLLSTDNFQGAQLKDHGVTRGTDISLDEIHLLIPYTANDIEIRAEVIARALKGAGRVEAQGHRDSHVGRYDGAAGQAHRGLEAH